MSFNMPLRPLGRSGGAFASHQPRVYLKPLIPRRTIFDFFRRKERPAPIDPITLEYSKRKPSMQQSQQLPQQGDLASNSIFETEGDVGKTVDKDAKTGINYAHRTMVLDPNPKTRKEWERKKVIQEIRKRQRINKTTLLARTEREHLARSQFYRTSIKKLGPLARQIAGKPIDEAILQMRFSKKKVAKDVLEHLKYAKDRAIVMNGMGLGAAALPEGQVEPTVEVGDYKQGGGKKVVRPKSAIYVDQAWIGRGAYTKSLSHRARGQGHLLMSPQTSLTVLLKEEATRGRLTQEWREKKANKKVWVPLPDRPITAQRQYCLW